MCGRTACTLAPDDVCKACGRQLADGHWVQPRWIDSPDGNKYYPSYNMSPTSYSPVLISAKHAISTAPEPGNAETDCDWVIQPMRWGLIPSWHHGDANSMEYKMNNARSDGLLSKASFKKPLERGRRCVVLADGYYEWNRSLNGKKQPYLIYFPQSQFSNSECVDVNKNESIKKEPDDTDIKDCLSATSKDRLLTMAGIFDTWKSHDSESLLFSYTLITVDAHDRLAWMHDRMPAILDGETEIKAWLDYESVPLAKALSLIRPTDCVQWHAVSPVVNNSRNNSEDCVKPYIPGQDEKKKPSASANMMKAWLSTGLKRSIATSEDATAKFINKKLKD